MRAYLVLVFLCFNLIPTVARAETSVEVICSFAPSQNINQIKQLLSVGAIATVSRETVLLENGFKYVQHSSGKKILINNLGQYIRGTLSRPIGGPVILVATIVAGTAITFELACSPINHESAWNDVKETAETYSSSAYEKLDDLLEKVHSYKLITEDKFYELMGETWYERAIRKTKRSLNLE